MSKKISILGLTCVLLMLSLSVVRAEDTPWVVFLLSEEEQATEYSGGTYSVSITTLDRVTWTATTDSSWITLSATSGTGGGTFSYTVAASSVVYRTGTITFTAGTVSRTLQVTQQEELVWPVGNSSGSATYNSAYGLNTATDLEFTLNGITYESKGTVVTGVGNVTSFYGTRTTSQNSSYYRHWAIDIDVGTSTESVARAALSGEVYKVGCNDTNGYYVYIEHQYTLNGTTTTLSTRYLHLDSYCVSEGDLVSAGDKIGIIGSTGTAGSDIHLHFAVTKKIGSTHYALNPVAYYHGSDDRGGTSGLVEKTNNPMFIISSSSWIPNPNWNFTYSSFTGTGSTFFANYMNAKRKGTRILTAAY